MNLQSALFLLVGIISALNASLYGQNGGKIVKYGEIDINDCYENCGDPFAKTRGMSIIFFS